MTDNSESSRSIGAAKPRKLGATPILLVCFLAFLITLLLYSPGYMSYDSLAQLKQARNLNFTDNHPPIMAVIWAGMDRICSGQFGMLLLQTLLYWCGLAVFFIYLRGWLWLRVLAVLLVGFYPPIFGMVGTVWKDLLMLGSLTLAVGMMVRFERQKGVLVGLGIIVLLFVATAARHNSVVAIPPLVFWLAHSFRFVHAKRRRWTILRAGAFALAVTGVTHVSAGAFADLLVKQSSHHWQCVAMYDIVGISAKADQMLVPEDAAFLTRPATLDDIKGRYDPMWSNILWQGWTSEDGIKHEPLFRKGLDAEGLSALKELWVDSLLNHPIAYLQHRWDAFAYLLGVGNSRLYSPFYYSRIRSNDLGLTFQVSWANQKLYDGLIWLCGTKVYRIWVYVLLLFVFSGVSLWSYMKTGRSLLLALSFSGLLYMLAYFPTVPSAHFRYSLWGLMMVVLWVGAGLCQLTARSSDPPAVRPVLPKAAERPEPHSSEVSLPPPLASSEDARSGDVLDSRES